MIRELINEHLQDLALLNYSKNTIANKQYNLKKFILYCEERSICKPDEISLITLQQYQKHIFSQRHKGNPLTIQVQFNLLNVVKLWFAWLLKKNHILTDCSNNWELPKFGKRLPRNILTEEEVRLVLDKPDLNTPKGIRDKAILETLYSSSIRRNELIHIKIYDVRFEQGIVFIAVGKGNKQRIVPIGEKALFWIEKYLSESRPNVESDYLFLSCQKKPFHKSSITALCSEYIKSAEVKKGGSTHQFRRASATHMVESGIDIVHLQKVLGHESLDTTQVYIDLAIERLKEAHKKFHPK